MTIKINVPNIGEDILEVTEILVKIGDEININQPLLIIEGDKSSIEIPSPYSGIIEDLYLAVGDQVHTGSVILLLNINNNHNHAESLKDNKTHVKYHADNKVNFLKHHNIKQLTDIVCNDIQHRNTPSNLNYNNNQSVHATPLIRHMARKLGINLSHIKGSGRKGRIIKEDIQSYLDLVSMQHNNYNLSINSDPECSTTDTNATINCDKFGNIEIIQLNKIQKISGFNLQKNWSIIPHVTQFDVVDITNLEIFRKQQNLEISKKNVNCKITILVFIIKSVAKALEQLPRFNSSLSTDGHTLVLKKYINIGIAVDTKKGLVVPVLRHVNKKGIITLSQELSEIAQKARAGNQLTPIDMQGGSFTISNLGGIGGTGFTPIINAPEVAILGVSKSTIRPIWIKNKFIPRLMLPLSLSYDHRVINGADGARFINLINKIISDIRLLSM